MENYKGVKKDTEKYGDSAINTYNRRDFMRITGMGLLSGALASALFNPGCKTKEKEIIEEEILPITDEIEGVDMIYSEIRMNNYNPIINTAREEYTVAITNPDGSREEISFVPDGWVEYKNNPFYWTFEFDSSSDGVTSSQKEFIERRNSMGPSMNKVILIGVDTEENIREKTRNYLDQFSAEADG